MYSSYPDLLLLVSKIRLHLLHCIMRYFNPWRTEHTAIYDTMMILYIKYVVYTNTSVYAENHLQPIGSILRRRRLTFAGHCYRCFESAPQPIMDVLFFSMRGTRTRGNRSNYRKLLSEETLLDETSLQNAMLNRDYWKTITR